MNDQWELADDPMCHLESGQVECCYLWLAVFYVLPYCSWAVWLWVSGFVLLGWLARCPSRGVSVLLLFVWLLWVGLVVR
jgi:hypothetical protein